MVETLQVIKLCNEGVRPTMDMFAVAYYAAKRLIDAYDSGKVEAMLPEDAEFSNFIADGSDKDGRPQLSVGGLKLLMLHTKAIVEQLESTKTESGLSLIQGVISVAPKFA